MATHTIKIEIDKNFDIIQKKLYDLPKILTSMEFKDYLLNKILEEMKKIIQSNVTGFGSGEEHSIFLAKIEEYKKNNKSEINGNTIRIYNDTILKQAEMTWVKEETKANYPDGLSIAYLVEYGTGLLGEGQEDWAVNMNGHNASWSYIDPEGMYKHSTGISPRFVYLKTKEAIEQKINKWFDEYIKEEGDLL